VVKRVTFWVATYGLFAVVAFVNGCSSSNTPADTLEDTLEDTLSDVPPDALPDTPPDTPPEVLPDVATDPPVDAIGDADVRPGGLNGCGGERALAYTDVEVEPGVACGDFGEGVIVCAGLDTVVCAGQSARNACGGRGVLPVTLGESCGLCDDGVWACADDGSASCLGAREPNACGGCAPVGGRPGAVCAAEGTAGTWVCTTRESLACVSGSVNACGGEDALTWDAEPAGPGQPCDAGCGVGDGVLVCAGADTLECVLTTRSMPANACGGCGALPGELGDGCGLCGAGVWRCADTVGEMICEGAEAVDACGGCEEDAHAPGSSCSEGRLWMCEGQALVCAAPVDGSLRNACNGTSRLDHEVGSACGACGNGTWVCATPNQLRCEDDVVGNACGGCESALGRPDDACGACGTGVLTCEGTRLVCVGDDGPTARNACGGCGVLAAEPGVTCGRCLSWVCTEAGGLRCEADPDLDVCEEFVTCDDLECDAVNRACEESDGVDDARCGSCESGFVERAGACVLESPDELACADAGCPDQNRVCVQARPEADATCAECIVGYEEDVEEEAIEEAPGTCVIVDCGAPWPLSGGTVAWSGTTYGAEAAYRCHFDEVLVGEELRVCQADGSWSGGPPACNRLGSVCAADVECLSGTWCPTDTSERRCSPRPLVGGVEIPFQWVPGGTFTLGSPSGETGHLPDESEVTVELTSDYFVQRTPVTQGHWAAVTEAWNALPSADRTMSGWAGATPVFSTTPSCYRSESGTNCTTTGSNPDRPVERVNWWDAVVFANALSILEGLDPCYTLTGCGTGTGVSAVGGGCSGAIGACSAGTFSCSDAVFIGKSCTGYRLATEAEWERAARAGTTTATYGGDLSESNGCVTLSGAGEVPSGTPLADLAWYNCNSSNRTNSVGAKLPNAWGLHDMLGNVWEWTGTRYAVDQSDGTDPLGPSTGSFRVLRGGSWVGSAADTRAANRNANSAGGRSDINGFRLVRTNEP